MILRIEYNPEFDFKEREYEDVEQVVKTETHLEVLQVIGKKEKKISIPLWHIDHYSLD